METQTQGSINRVLPALFALIPSFPLSGMVASFLDRRYVPTDDDLIFFSLFGCAFLVLFELFFLLFLVGWRLRAGQRRVATRRELSILGLGLLIAPVLGVLPWSFRWLYASSPWVPFVLRALLAVWLIVELVRTWKLPRAERTTFLITPVIFAYMVALEGAPVSVKITLMPLPYVAITWSVLAYRKRRRAGTA